MNKRSITIDFSKCDSVETIKTKLTKHIDDLVNALYPECYVHVVGKQIRVGSKGSLAIDADGRWYSHEDQIGGDVIGLIMRAKSCDFKSALKFARDFLQAEPLRHNRKQSNNKSNPDTRQHAYELWKSGIEINDTLAAVYLNVRGIMTVHDSAVNKMRFIPKLKHVPSGKHYPCLLTRLDGADGKFAGVLRTYLHRDGMGKASAIPNKMLLGETKAAAIRFRPALEHLVVTEGPEDALSIMAVYSHLSAWCVVGASITNFTPPDSITSVTIAADNDDAGQKYAHRLARRLIHRGLDVEIMTPVGAKDFNEMLMNGDWNVQKN